MAEIDTPGNERGVLEQTPEVNMPFIGNVIGWARKTRNQIRKLGEEALAAFGAEQ